MIVVGGAGNLGIALARAAIARKNYDHNIVLMDRSWKNTPVHSLLDPDSRIKMMEEDAKHVAKAVQISKRVDGDRDVPTIVHLATTAREDNDVAADIAAVCHSMRFAFMFGVKMVLAVWDEDPPKVFWDAGKSDPWNGRFHAMASAGISSVISVSEPNFPLMTVQTGEMIGGHRNCLLKTIASMAVNSRSNPKCPVDPETVLTPVDAVAAVIMDAVQSDVTTSKKIDARWTDCKAGYVLAAATEVYKTGSAAYYDPPREKKSTEIIRMLMKRNGR